LHTNVNVSKRLKSGPVEKEPRNVHTMEEFESDPRPKHRIIKKKTYKKTNKKEGIIVRK